MLISLAPQDYQDFVRDEGNHKVLYVEMLKALYGMLQSSLLYYKKFRKDLKEIGFKINPYNPCIANRIIQGKQHTVIWHIDNLKSSHMNPEVNNEFLHWLKKTYTSENIGKIKAVRGKTHNYLTMALDFTIPEVLQVDMTAYIKKMTDEFPEILQGKTKHLWSETVSKVDKKSNRLKEEKKQIAIFLS